MKLLFASTLILAAFVVSCRRPESTATIAADPPAQTYIVQGFLRGINFAGRSITVEHEEIPNYMPAMTMPFDVKTMAEVTPLKAGDAIEFAMIVTEKAAWVEGVKKIEATEIQLPVRKETGARSGTNVDRLREGDRLPEFHLTDSKGRSITRETFTGKPLILTFIFTRCPIPNFCPLMTNNFKELRELLAKPPRRDPHLLSISIDPGFDTPDVLAEYAASHTADSDQWRFASGNAAETKRLTEAFSVSVQPEGGTLAHGLATALVDERGVIRKIWRGNAWTPGEVAAAARAL